MTNPLSAEGTVKWLVHSWNWASVTANGQSPEILRARNRPARNAHYTGCNWLWVIQRSPKRSSAAEAALARVRTEFQNVQRGT